LVIASGRRHESRPSRTPGSPRKGAARTAPLQFTLVRERLSSGGEAARNGRDLAGELVRGDPLITTHPTWRPHRDRLGFLAGRARELGFGHWQILLVLAIGTGIRVACEMAYHPALFFPDSWDYLNMALHSPFVGFLPLRPSGYPLLVRLFTLDNRTLLLLTLVQHGAGLATALMVYVIGLKLRLGRWVSAAAAALVALCGDWIALEQNIMTEPFFSLCLVGAVLAVLDEDAPRWRWILSGGLIAATALMRSGGLFAVPPWVAYMLIRHIGWRRALAGLLALAIPLLAYAALHDADGLGFGFSQSDGWFLYARVAPVAHCTPAWPSTGELRKLCPTAAEQADRWVPGDYLWDASSPARRLFPRGPYGPKIAYSSDLLGTFARQTLERAPLAYIGMVTSDFAGLFDDKYVGWESALTFGFPGERVEQTASVKAAYERHYERPARFPWRELRSYWHALHTPRLLIGVLTLAGLISLGLAAVWRRWRVHARVAETMLLTGVGVCLVYGTVATSALNLRYLLPAVPLLALGGALAFDSPLRFARDHRTAADSLDVLPPPVRE